MSKDSKPLVISGKTFEYQPTGENKIGEGAFGTVFVGIFKSKDSKGGKVAVKRVDLPFGINGVSDIEEDREVQALKTLRHPYIVILFAVEDDDNFRSVLFSNSS